MYSDAAQQALGLQQVGDTYVRPAISKNELIGLVGEVNLSNALERDGLIVFADQTKHVSQTGIDLVALDPTTNTVWLLDNKAQIKGISGASALTGSNFDAYKADVVNFLLNRSSHPRAAEAAGLITKGQFKKVVSNAWAGTTTTFTQAVFSAGLNVYDVRLGALFDSYPAWQSAFKKVVTKGLTKLPGMRGAAMLEGSMLVLAVYAGALYVMSADDALKSLGEFAAETALGAALCLLPGGFVAGLVIGLESDETPSQAAARKRQQTIVDITSHIPGFLSLSPAEQKQVSDDVGQLLDQPLIIPDPAPPPSAPPNRGLPGSEFIWPSNNWT
jgi:hypothetical protein